MSYTKTWLVVWLSCLIFVSAEGKRRFVPKSIPPLPESTNKFALALHNTFPSDGNVIYSPWSIAFTLGMILLGAKGKTAFEMKRAMSISQMETQSVHFGFKLLRDHLNRYGDDYEMTLYSTVFVQKQNKIQPTYKIELQRYYDADIHDMDFTQQGRLITELANVWTALKTNDKITEIMSTPPPPSTKMLLLAVNFFKGTWVQTFDKNRTKTAVFHNSDGRRPQVDMMYATRNITLYTGSSLALDAVDLPMKGDVSFLLVKPEDPKEMGTLQKNLSTEFFEEIYKDMLQEPVEIGVPKFKATSRVEMEDSLKLLGIDSMFSPSDADLSGISSEGELYVQDIIHKAVLEIDEDGAIAAAATTVLLESRLKVYKLHFDNPFLFFIRDTKSGLILFMGRISNM